MADGGSPRTGSDGTSLRSAQPLFSPSGEGLPAVGASDPVAAQRFDTWAILERLNVWDSLDDDEQRRFFGVCEYSGLDEAEHPLSSLLGESDTCCAIVRDIDGALYLLFEELPSGTWRARPLWDAHMPDDNLLDDLFDWLQTEPIDRNRLRAEIAALPPAAGSVPSFCARPAP
jgi:hypothetical protein